MLIRTCHFVLSGACLVMTLVACGDSDGASADGGATGATGNAGEDGPQQDCVDRINELRATLSLPPLARWTEAEDCSNQQSADDQAGGGAHGNFNACGESAQNTCPDWPTVSDVLSGCLDQMWAEGPPPSGSCDGACFQMHGHFINMSSKGYTKVACGFHDDGQGRVWSNQNFK